MTVRLAPGGPVNGLREVSYLYRGKPFLADANKAIREQRVKGRSQPSRVTEFSWDTQWRRRESLAKQEET